MNIKDADDKWKTFEKTGRIADYLDYRGVTLENVTEAVRNDNCSWPCAEGTLHGRQRQIH